MSAVVEPGRRWATRVEAARYANVSPSTIDRWCVDPKVPVRRYNAGRRKILIDLDEVDAYITANTSGGDR